MSSSEVRIIAKLCADFVFDKVIVRPGGPATKGKYIDENWPFFVPLAKDIVIFLLGDEFDVDAEDPPVLPHLVCESPDCKPTSEC
jgi:hypothetical protein